MAGKGFLRIVNWRKLQNYAVKNPPWIRTHTSAQTDVGPTSRWQAADRWLSLGLEGQAVLVNLWVYAAVTGLDGIFWGDPEYLRQMVPGLDGAEDLGGLLDRCLAARFLEAVDRDGRPLVADGEREKRG